VGKKAKGSIVLLKPIERKRERERKSIYVCVVFLSLPLEMMMMRGKRNIKKREPYLMN
jgi:hypothetical protein